MEEVIIHYGIKRRSGRYPWGSGGELLSTIDNLSSKGLSEVEIANGLEISTTELRNQKALATAEMREAQRINITRQKENGMSIAAISREFDIPQSTVRDLLKVNANLKYRIIKQIADLLRGLVDKFGYVDVGEGSEIFMNVSRTKLENAITLLLNEGYTVNYLRQEQLGTQGKKTSIMVLGGPNTTFKDVLENKGNIAIPNFFTTDSGKNFFQPDSITNVSSNRVLVRYRDDGGSDKDGLIELRRGVPDLNLGGKAYAQVRIGVDDKYYMKGMAVTRDDLPDGVDIIYYSSKLDTGVKTDAMKEQVTEGASRFGAVVKPNTYMLNGQEVPGVVNIVGDQKPMVEGSWATWKKNIASQVLSKQSPRLAQKQLDIVYENSVAELNDIMALTNPTVRSYLLRDFADKSDKASIDLKAAALPRQSTNVLLPDPGMKANEIYAPNYDNGEIVSLIRYPHGGVFEIPTLVVNNKYSDYRQIIGKSPKDAVAVNPEVAQKLSGADFDGDFVLVVPNKSGQIRTEPSLSGLKNFDPKIAYPPYPGMKPMDERQKQRLMGDITNLITDMTIKGANNDEIARAVRQSMVVIDAEKKELNYKQAYIDNGIASLKEKYQGGTRRGASTIISLAKSEYRIPARRDNYEIDPITGEKVYTFTQETYINKKTGAEILKTTKSTQGAEARDAYKLSSGTVIEGVYANYSNRMKGLANKARLETLKQVPTQYSPKARSTYRKEVEALDAKFKAAVRSRPIERKAQLLGGEIYKAKVNANPGMSQKDKTKEKGRSLVLARTRLNASKPTIKISPREWEAIEMGAISPTRLQGILRNADMDLVRSYATPRIAKAGLSTGKEARAKALLKAGYTTAEVASALGVSTSQVLDVSKDLGG
jgi:DNA-binding CsgD family transcriptional regulator